MFLVLEDQLSHIFYLRQKKKKHLKVTDTRMTRFFITLDQVNFVINSLKNMKEKNICSKIPSTKLLI